MPATTCARAATMDLSRISGALSVPSGFAAAAAFTAKAAAAFTSLLFGSASEKPPGRGGAATAQTATATATARSSGFMAGLSEKFG